MSPFRLIVLSIVFLSCASKDQPILQAKSIGSQRLGTNLKCLLVFKDNKLVKEEYLASGKFDLHHLRSATKSITSTLIGIAFDKGFIESLDDSISDYLAEVPDDKKVIKIKHLLSMTSGLQWNEGPGYNDHNSMIDSGDPLAYMLGLKVVHKPGTKWRYSSGDMHLLSIILSKATNMSTSKFAEKYLFEPLGISKYRWQVFNGVTAGSSRLQLLASDMIKIGQMYAANGIYDGVRILSSQYINEATAIQSPEGAFGGEDEGYGYGLWTIRIKGKRAFMAMGYGGQMIFVAPDYSLVVVTTHHWKLGYQVAEQQQQDAQRIAFDYLGT